jgi:uncharacterized membrane protein
MTATLPIRRTDRRLETHELKEPLLRPAMAEIDLIRAIAILVVLFYHGFFGDVDLA